MGINISDLVKAKAMSLTSEEPPQDHDSSNEHFFIKEDAKDQRSDEEDEDTKDENENKPDLAHANIFAALAALQTGQLTLSQVKLSYAVKIRWFLPPIHSFIHPLHLSTYFWNKKFSEFLFREYALWLKQSDFISHELFAIQIQFCFPLLLIK